MLKLITIFAFALSAVCCQAQVLQPVQWQFSAKKVTDDTYQITLSATIDSPWYMYAQDTPAGGPLPTTIQFNPNPMIILQGKTRRVGRLHRKQDPMFGVGVHYFTGQVSFVQLVQLRSNVTTELSGTVAFMACDQTRCLPPETVPFTLTLD